MHVLSSYLTQSQKSGFFFKEPSAKWSTHVFCSQNMFLKPCAKLVLDPEN